MREPPEDSLIAALRASMPDRPTGECPSAETLHAAAAGDLATGTLEAVVRHVHTCKACAEDLRVSAALVAEAERGRGAVADRRGLQRRILAVAGLGALAAALFLVLLRSPSDRAQSIRGSSTDAAGRSSLLAVSSTLQPRSGATLAWSAVPGAVRYEVRISTEDLALLEHATVERSTAYAIPGPVVERARGAPLLWQVDAVLRGGERVSSPTFHLRFIPDAGPP